MGSTPTDGSSCTCSTIDLESGSVTLAVLAEGAETASVSQQVSQVNGDARVHIDINYGGTDVEISGETASNGSLVLSVTRNGEVVDENIVVAGDETDTVVFHLHSDGVSVSTDEEVPSECTCGQIDVNVSSGVDVGSEADIAKDVGDQICDVTSDIQVNEDEQFGLDIDNTGNVNAGNVSINVPVLGPSSDSSSESNQVIDENGDDRQSPSNDKEGNSDKKSTQYDECVKESSSSSDSTSLRSSIDPRTGENMFRIVFRPNDFGELSETRDDSSTAISVGEILSEWGYGPETGAD